jgi:6-phosphogluconolactonase (cycloisomerase 2 family)
MKYNGYVGTTSTRGSCGVYQIQLDGDTGAISVQAVRPMYNSGYLTVSQDRKNLYVLSEGMTFLSKASGGITAYRIEDGAFEELNAAISGGQRPCFVSCDDAAGEIYVGNFFAGTISVFERKPDGSLGERKAFLQHEKLGPFGPAIHCVAKCPTGRYLAALELSCDSIYVYDCEDNYRICWRERLPEHSAPRHMVFSADGTRLYINRQADEKVSVYRFAPEEERVLTPLQSLSCRSKDMVGVTEPAAIRLCPGKLLLAVSNRGMGSRNREDSISLFHILEEGTLELSQVVRTGGQMPRDFCFTPDGAFLVVGYQFQGYLDVYRVEADGDLTYLGRGADIPSPVCIAF